MQECASPLDTSFRVKDEPIEEGIASFPIDVDVCPNLELTEEEFFARYHNVRFLYFSKEDALALLMLSLCSPEQRSRKTCSANTPLSSSV